MRRSKLILFLSADIVGSTAYKHNNRESKGRPQPWLQFFQDFYQEFPACVTRFCGKQNDKAPSPTLWKSAGDELLFTVELNCHNEALQQVYGFQLAIREYAHQIKKKKLPLGIKGCAWTAGFPVINAIVTPDGGADDFIGPLIDAGFRLSKYASERKFVISVETTLLLAMAWKEPTAPKLTFYFDGKEVLKGVLSERPYPIIWIDMLDGNPTLEEQLKGIDRRAAKPDQLIEFCKHYIDEAAPDLVIPYMGGCSCAEFSTPPEFHLSILNEMFDPQGMIELTDANEPAGGANAIDFDNIPTKTATL